MLPERTPTKGRAPLSGKGQNIMPAFIPAFSDGIRKEYGKGIYSEKYRKIDSNDKPYLPGHPGIHFNLSHCEKAVFCGISKYPIGVDIQDTITDAERLAHIICTPREQELMKRAEPPTGCSPAYRFIYRRTPAG